MIGHNNHRYAPLFTRRIHKVQRLGNYVTGIWNTTETQGYAIINSLHLAFSIINDLIKEANLSRDLFIYFTITYRLFFC